MAAPLKLVFAAAILAVALPRLKAWATGQWYCHRLVPLSITSVATPCTFPCVLISPDYGHHGIVVRQEADGTPCKESHCRNGICQLSGLRPHLKRMKRDTIHRRKRRALAERRKTETQNGGNNQGDGKKKRRKRRKKRRKKIGN
ncbi:uncharacterized protein LOC142786694 isoform X2 [Rhipicephalus microplus]|uniref:uncharacterized protein LOC142786694 isoform X2 n=1 Tax=Rhipicephalus microplus TaxID=6941 RepID=UPI003F6A9FFB